MASVKTPTVITDEDLLREENQWREVVNGEWVDAMSASISHVFVVKNALKLLDEFVTKHDLGAVLPDGLHYKLDAEAPGIRDSRIPDVSFLRKGRITPQTDLSRPFPGTPDLAIEMVSSGETEASIVDKVHAYLDAGTEEVWVLYPSVEEVYRHQRNNPKTIRVYGGNDVLDGGDLFPGLEIIVSAFFTLPKV